MNLNLKSFPKKKKYVRCPMGLKSGLMIRRHLVHLVRIAFVSIIVITFGFLFWRKSKMMFEQPSRPIEQPSLVKSGIPKFRPPPQLLPSGSAGWTGKRCNSDEECNEGSFCNLNLQFPICEPLIFAADAPNDKTPAWVFEQIYALNSWHSIETRSGMGSELYTTKHVRRCLGEWIQKYNIKSFGDICGDANWQAHIPGIHDIEYVGYDVAENALTRAREKNAQYGFKFQFLDVSASPPPKHDAFMIRD
eukprot:Selendium_serpulae@DN2741_c0_g1_i2.p1